MLLLLDTFDRVFHVFLIWMVCHPVLWSLWDLAATRSKALWSLSVPPLPPTHAAQSLGRVFASEPWWWKGSKVQPFFDCLTSCIFSQSRSIKSGLIPKTKTTHLFLCTATSRARQLEGHSSGQHRPASFQRGIEGMEDSKWNFDFVWDMVPEHCDITAISLAYHHHSIDIFISMHFGDIFGPYHWSFGILWSCRKDLSKRAQQELPQQVLDRTWS